MYDDEEENVPIFDNSKDFGETVFEGENEEIIRL